MLKARRSKIHSKATTKEIIPDRESDQEEIPAEEIQPLSPGESEYEDPRDSVDLDKIRSLLINSDLSGGYIRLLRKGPTDTQFNHVAKIGIEDFDVENVKKLYGGGDYKVWTHRADGKKYKLFQFGIDHRMRGRLDDPESPFHPLPTGDGTSSKTLELMANLMPKQQDTTPLLMKVMETTSAKSDQMMLMMVSMMTKSQETQAANMTAMMSAMATMASANKSSGPSEGVATFVPILIEMIKSQGSGKSAVSSLAETVGIVKEIKGMMEGKSDEDEEKEESMLDKLIKIGAPLLGNIMAARAGMAGPAVPAGPAVAVDPRAVPIPPRLQRAQVAAGPAGGAVPSQEQKQPDPNAGTVPNESQAVVGLFLAQLVKAASRGSDPGIYADLIFDNLSDPQLEQLAGVLQLEDWCSRLFGDDPRIVAHQGWFEELRILILTEFQQADGNESGNGDSDVKDEVELAAARAAATTAMPTVNANKSGPTDLSNGVSTQQPTPGKIQ